MKSTKTFYLFLVFFSTLYVKVSVHVRLMFSNNKICIKRRPIYRFIGHFQVKRVLYSPTSSKNSKLHIFSEQTKTRLTMFIHFVLPNVVSCFTALSL